MAVATTNIAIEAEEAKGWANKMDGTVDDEEYSAKYYMTLTKEEHELAIEDISTTAKDVKNTAISEIETSQATALISIDNAGKSFNTLTNRQINNCITEIPQRIKADVVDGTLTVYAGTVAIVPYGTTDRTSEFPVGSTFIHENFKVVDTQFADGLFFVWVEVQGNIQVATTISDTLERLIEIELKNNSTRGVINTISSATQYSGTSNCVNYRTDLNIVQYSGSGTLDADDVISLPILKVKADGTYVYGSITQTFNGIGYIGSTYWLDKGYKGLIANYRHADGTLKNIEWNNDKLTMWTFDSSKNYPVVYMAYGDDFKKADYMLVDLNNWVFDEINNIWVYRGLPQPWIDLGTCTVTAGVISNFNPKQPVRLLDGSGDITVRGLVKSVASVADFRLQTTKGDITTLSDKIPENESNIFGQVVYTDKNNELMGYQRVHHNISDQLNLQTAVRRMVNGVAKSATTSLMVGVDGTQYFNFPHCKTKATTTSTASSNKVAVVVQNYVNDKSWYRVWSDGWIEQGGRTSARSANGDQTITYSKAFSDTNYTIIISNMTNLQTNESGVIHTMTKSNCKVYAWSGRQTSWYACGY